MSEVPEREPHLFDDATIEELGGMSRKDLLDYTVSRGWGGHNFAKAKLIELIEAKRSGVQSPSPSAESEPEEEAPEVISPEAARKLSAASDAQILDWLERNTDARQCLIDFANGVLMRRAEERRKAEAEAALRTDLDYYRVTKGGRIGTMGMWATLATGSVVTPATHDLDSLRVQGIELESVRQVRVEPNQVGIPVTVIDLE